jgi:hypothetical protein
MPVTISYDLDSSTLSTNDRNYLRSALERFHWKRLGGSVFRYDGIDDGNGGRREDWLNHVAPALMFVRSFLQKKSIKLSVLTVDAFSVARVDLSDPAAPYGDAPQPGSSLVLAQPTNAQSSEKALRDFVDACSNASP